MRLLIVIIVLFLIFYFFFEIVSTGPGRWGLTFTSLTCLV